MKAADVRPGDWYHVRQEMLSGPMQAVEVGVSPQGKPGGRPTHAIMRTQRGREVIVALRSIIEPVEIKRPTS